MAKQTFFGPPEKEWSDQAGYARHMGFNLLRDFEPMMHELYPESKAYNFGYYSEEDINNQQTIGWKFMTSAHFDVENFDKTVGSRFGLRLDVHDRVMHGNNYIMLMSKKHRDDVILPARKDRILAMEAAAEDDSVIVHPEDPEFNRMKDAGRELSKTEKAKVQVKGSPEGGSGSGASDDW
jgi:hypothetical protein